MVTFIRIRIAQKADGALGAKGKIECLVSGPGRFWPALLAARDHNGSTCFQHRGFRRTATGAAFGM
jgi:hypothetical protein